MISKELAEKLKKDIGILIPSILVPRKNVDMSKWSVVACDQYTSEHNYWSGISQDIGESPSTLRLIYPEAYLDIEDGAKKADRISAIHIHMKSYLEDDIFEELTDTVILVERKFSSGKTRCGLMLALDLERYDYSTGSQSLIRATEGTILNRLPPRIKIRENALLELPHIMVLIDDRDRTVIEPLLKQTEQFAKAYNFSLMKGSGSIRGWKIEQEQYIESIYRSLSNLSDPVNFKKKYGIPDNDKVLLFAMGDGNHSLATAKACWDNLKKTLTSEEIETNPARYALVEIINLHDEGLEFEPINRLLFNVDSSNFLKTFCEFFNKKGCCARTSRVNPPELPGSHVIRYISSKSTGYLVVDSPVSNLDVATLQSFIDLYIKENPAATVDYVHGEDVTKKIGSMEGNMGFFLSPMNKNELFKTVLKDGALPRKTFSMGEAAEKRFYLEARKIR